MTALLYLLYIVHVLVSFFLILVVLFQQGKGADLSVFGGGSTQAAFGARGAATFLHKLTVWGFVLFTATTLSIAFMETQNRSGSSVMSGMEESVMDDEAAAGETGEALPAEGTEAEPAAEGGEAMDTEAVEGGDVEATGEGAGLAPNPDVEETIDPPGEGG